MPLLTAEAAAASIASIALRVEQPAVRTGNRRSKAPSPFGTARFYPAVEYIQANRVRTLAVRQLSALFEEVDIIVTPSFGAQLVATNLTGHPALILPNGLRGDDAPHPAAIDDGDHDDIGIQVFGVADLSRWSPSGSKAGRIRPRLPASHGLPQPTSQTRLIPQKLCPIHRTALSRDEWERTIYPSRSFGTA